MISIRIEDTLTDWTNCLKRVEAGETVLVFRGDRPVAEIKPVIPNRKKPRPFGLCAGEFTVPDDFDDPLPDTVVSDFEGK